MSKDDVVQQDQVRPIRYDQVMELENDTERR